MPFHLRDLRFLRPLAYVGVLGLSVVAFSSSSSFLGNTAVELVSRNASSATAATTATRQINVPSIPVAAPGAMRPAFDPNAAAPPIGAIDPGAGAQPESSTTSIDAPSAGFSDITTLQAPGAASTMAAAPSPRAAQTALSDTFVSPSTPDAPADTLAPADDLAQQPAADTPPTDLPMPGDNGSASAQDNVSTAQFNETSQQQAVPVAEGSIAGAQPFVVVSSVNVHTRPTNGSPRVSTLQRGQQVSVVADDQGWLQIAADGEVVGWVYHTFLAAR